MTKIKRYTPDKTVPKQMLFKPLTGKWVKHDEYIHEIIVMQRNHAKQIHDRDIKNGQLTRLINTLNYRLDLLEENE